ncbi:MAG: ProQ/FinO family protein [Marinobacterium sp.]|nr:ProQ/FinO family protein [Marinobacterium sp.]
MSSSIEHATDDTLKLLDELDQMLSEREQSQPVRSPKVSEATKVSEAIAPETTTPATTASASAAPAKPKSRNRAANMAALQLLIDAYPEVFNRDNIRPLKIGIQEDLVADEKVAKNKIKRALASYVRSLGYIRTIREGVDRIDINGQPAGKVTADEALHAKNTLRDINKKRRQQQAEREKQKAEQEKQARMSNKLEALVSMNRR